MSTPVTRTVSKEANLSSSKKEKKTKSDREELEVEEDDEDQDDEEEGEEGEISLDFPPVVLKRVIGLRKLHSKLEEVDEEYKAERILLEK